MSKKKGLSVDEKKTRMLQLFHEKMDFFQLKELEKIAPKEKGITMQSVKEVIQALVDDHLVDTEKIGTSIYFWSFPSKAKHSMKRKLNQLQTEQDECTKKIHKIEDYIKNESIDRIQCDSRKILIENLNSIVANEVRLKRELEKYRESDPEYLTQLRSEIDELKSASNRWTENIYILKSYLKGKFNMEETVINKSFNLPEELDYIDE